MIQFDEDKQNRRVTDLHKREEEELVQLLASKYGTEYVDLTITAISSDALRLIEEKDAREAKAAGYALIDKKIRVAVRNPEDPKVAELVAMLREKKLEPELHIASMTSLEKAWLNYKDLSFAYESKAGSLEIASEEIATIVSQAKSLPTIISILENTMSTKKSYRVSHILETIIAGALASDASDIHIEPEEAYIRLRYRLDGVLIDIIKFDKDTFNLLISRIKLLSGLKLNVKKSAQDGRFSVHFAETDIEIRTSVLPGAYSESVVMRLLNPKSIGVPLEELGIPPKLMAVIDREINKPNGMLLTTGPTGSGKTTTLYAFLKKVHNPEIKIITIEDPIEYHLEGITQTQTNDKGYNFLEGLRSALRQDPDVIMVGEIRDSETAAIAINSALTGHLVFSTLHTNSAAGAFPRLIDLGINPKIMSSAINIVLAQRLVRKLCPVCKKEVDFTAPPTGDAILDKHIARAKHIVEKVVATIVDRTDVPANITKMWTPVGCDKCNKTGYKGRVGIYEGIMITEDINKVVEYSASEAEVAKAAVPQGLLTMTQGGVVKILEGLTSLDELERVISIEE
ncbi:MAG: type pilus assembly ATPase PilB, type pilus assembly protein PilB [Candidatus Parcubacteria bacterium]|jgi:type IV pilus assembly protein PilB